jgi:hypothetical protein
MSYLRDQEKLAHDAHRKYKQREEEAYLAEIGLAELDAQDWKEWGLWILREGGLWIGVAFLFSWLGGSIVVGYLLQAAYIIWLLVSPCWSV